MTMEKLHHILSRLEALIRGKVSGKNAVESETKALEKLSEDLLNWTELETTAIESETKKAVCKSAITLFNKARNLVATIYADLRAILKAAAAWILYSFASPGSDGLINILKVLATAARELSTIPHFKRYALKCCVGATNVWSRFNISALINSLPPLELQEIKIQAFNAYLNVATLSDDADQTRLSVNGALDLAQTLPNGLKVTFACTVEQIATKKAVEPTLDDAVHYFKISLHGVDIVLASARRNDHRMYEGYEGNEEEDSLVNSTELEIMRQRVQIALAYSYSQLDQAEKALACLKELELKSSSTSIDLNHTLLVAKFNIYTRSSDWEEARTCLTTLITSARCPFDTALASVNLYLQNCLSYHIHADEVNGLELFKVLVHRFPNGSEYTRIRISNIRIAIASTMMCAGMSPDSSHTKSYATATAEQMQQESVALSGSQRAFFICEAVVSDHCKGTRILDGESFKAITDIFFERVQWYRYNHNNNNNSNNNNNTIFIYIRSREEWVAVTQWAAQLRRLLTEQSAGKEYDKEKLVLCLFHLVDAHLHLRRHKEAAALAKDAFNLAHSSSALLILFKALLCHRGGNAAVEEIIQCMKTLGAENGTGSNKSMSLDGAGEGDVGEEMESSRLLRSYNRSEDFDRLQYCCVIATELEAEDMSATEREAALMGLISAWLQLYESSMAWRNSSAAQSVRTRGDEEDEDTGECEGSADRGFFSYIIHWLEVYTQSRLCRVGEGDAALVSVFDDQADGNHSAEKQLQQQDQNQDQDQLEPQRKRSRTSTYTQEKSPETNKAGNLNLNDEFSPVVASPVDTDNASALAKPSSPDNAKDAVSGLLMLLGASDTPAAADAAAADAAAASSPTLSSPVPKVHNNANTEVSNNTPHSAGSLSHSVSTGFYYPGSHESASRVKKSGFPGNHESPEEMTRELYHSLHTPEAEIQQDAVVMPHKRRRSDSSSLEAGHVQDRVLESLDSVIKPISHPAAPSPGNAATDISAVAKVSFADTVTKQPHTTGDKRTNSNDNRTAKVSPIASYPHAHAHSLTAFGYPHFMNDLLGAKGAHPAAVAGSVERGCRFLGTVADFRSNIVDQLRRVVTVISIAEKDGVDVLALGSFDELNWLAEFAWNLGVLFVPLDHCKFHPPVGYDEPFALTYIDSLTLAADCLELAEALYSRIAYADPTLAALSQSFCLLLSAGARLDIDSLASRSTNCVMTVGGLVRAAGSGGSVKYAGLSTDHIVAQAKPTTQRLAPPATSSSPDTTSADSSTTATTATAAALLYNIEIVRCNTSKADELLRSIAGFGGDDSSEHRLDVLRKLALAFEFAAMCKVGPAGNTGQNLDNYVHAREGEFLRLNAMELMSLAKIAETERGGTVDATRSVLHLALQASSRGSLHSFNGTGKSEDIDGSPECAAMGSILLKLIELSPSRAAALERVEEFEQLVTSHAYSSFTTNNTCFDADAFASRCHGDTDTATDIGTAAPLQTNSENNSSTHASGCASTTAVAVSASTTAFTSSFFDIEDVDRVTSLAYNYGITLAELGQVDMAERFISKAVSLARYASPAIRLGWKQRMHDTYESVLQRKSGQIRNRKQQ